MASEVEICNLALSHLRIAPGISSLEERSEEARTCSLFYEQVRDEVLREFPWPFATRIVALALVEEQPTSEWAYSYRYPTDCLQARRVVSGAGRIETRATRVPYRLASDDAGPLIYADQAEAEVEYTARIDDPTHYAPDFVQAVALLLAFYIAPRVTSGDQFKLGDRALGMYRVKLHEAEANALEEEQPDPPAEGELTQARDA